jgi:imidazolonepropionase-like amidohydrolase
VEHGFYLDDIQIERMVKSGTFLVPTLSAADTVLRQAQTDPHIHDHAVRAARELSEVHFASFARAHKAGVKIAMGSDTFGWDHGKSLIEAELLVRGGMTEGEAIVAGTSGAAACIGLGHKVGSIETNKLADLLVVEGDPLADIRILQNTDRLRAIMKDGKMVKNTL